MEVGADKRKTLLRSKIKLGWHVCRTDDHETPNRCFKFSTFNHRLMECRGEVTCPLCAGPHTIKECKSNTKAYKCINCERFKRHNPTKEIRTDHSALDKGCPSLQAILERNRLNAEY